MIFNLIFDEKALKLVIIIFGAYLIYIVKINNIFIFRVIWYVFKMCMFYHYKSMIFNLNLDEKASKLVFIIFREHLI